MSTLSHSTSRNWKVGIGIGLLVVGAAIVVMKNTPPAPLPPAPVVRASLDPITIPALPLDKEMQIRPDLREALGKVAGITAQQRLDLLVAVRGTLSEIECDALLHELLEPRHPAVPEGWFSVYVQNICMILREQPKVRESYARVLSTLVHDLSRDAVVRDYAVQHLRQVWDRAAEMPAVRQAIENDFRSLATGSEPAMAATGLLSLHLLGTPDGAAPMPGVPTKLPPGMAVLDGKASPTGYQLPDSQLQPLVDGILKAPASAANLPARMTALRIVAERDLSSSKPELRRIAADTAGEHALARMAAISALGKLKDPADRPLLDSLDRSDPRIKSAVATALASLK